MRVMMMMMIDDDGDDNGYEGDKDNDDGDDDTDDDDDDDGSGDCQRRTFSASSCLISLTPSPCVVLAISIIPESLEVSVRRSKRLTVVFIIRLPRKKE